MSGSDRLMPEDESPQWFFRLCDALDSVLRLFRTRRSARQFGKHRGEC